MFGLEFVGMMATFNIVAASGWDVSTAVYSGKSYQSNEVNNMVGICLSADGTKYYVLDSITATKNVFQYTLSISYDISSATYSGKSMNVAGQETGPRCMAISSDGTKIYISGTGGNRNVYQYTLSTPFDVSTGSYASITFDPSAQITARTVGVFFNSVGTKMYLLDNGASPNRIVYQYTLSTPWDISTATYASKSFSILTQVGASNGGEALFFKPDGTKFWSQVDSIIYQYTLSTPDDISTAFYSGKKFDANAQVGAGRANLFFSPDGTKMYYGDTNSNITYEYNVTATPPPPNTSGFTNISLTSYTGKSFLTTGQVGAPTSVFVSPDGTKMYVTDTSHHFVYQYTLSTPFDTSTATYSSKSFNTISQTNSPWGSFFSSDGTKMYVSGQSNGIIYQYTLSTPWDISTASYASKSFNASSQETNIGAFCFTGDGTGLYIVGTAETIYQYTLSTPWDVSTTSYTSKSLLLTVSENGAVGISMSPDGTSVIIFAQGINPNSSMLQYYLTVPYDITTGIYTYKVFHSVAESDNGTRGGYITTDGLNIYTVGGTLKTIYQYKIATGAFYLNGSSFTGKTLLTANQNTTPRQFVFSTDGTTAYLCTSSFLYEYGALIPFDISSCYYTSKAFNTSSQATAMWGLCFKSDGTKAYIVGTSNNIIYQYTLGTPWDLSTISYASLSFNTSSQATNVIALAMSADGTKVYVHDLSHNIYQYTLGTPYDISTASYASKTFSTSAQDSGGRGLYLSNDGSFVYIAGSTNTTLYQYLLTTPYDISTAVYTDIIVNVVNEMPANNDSALSLSNDGTKVYVSASNSDATSGIIEYNLLPTTPFDLSIATYHVQGFDPSFNASSSLGVSLSTDGTKMYTNDTTTLWEFLLTVPFNINTAYYSGKSFSFSGQDSTGVDVNFSPSGKKMYLSGRGSNKIYQYTLSTAWDISTASYASLSLDASAHATSLYGIFLSLDGIQLYIANFASGSNSKIVQYTLSTAYNISTATYAYTFVVNSQIPAGPGDVVLSSDGTTMYVQGNTNKKIFQYTLTVPGNISTATYTGKSLDVALYGPLSSASGLGLALSPDNTLLYVVPDSNNPLVVQYALTTPPSWDISTTVYTGKSFDVTGQIGSTSIGSGFSNDGLTMFVGNFTTPATIYQYSLTIPFDVSTASYASKSFSVSSQLTDLRGFTFKPDGKTMYAQGHAPTTAIYQYTLSTAWDISTASYASKTKTLSSQDSFPNGVTFAPNGDKFYIAGNQNATVYEYTMSTQWDVSTASYASKSFNTSFGNLGIIAMRPDGKKIYLSDSTGSHPIKQYSLATAYDISTASYDGLFFNDAQDSAPFGISITPDGLNMFIVGAANSKVYQYTMGSLVTPALTFAAVTGAGNSTVAGSSPDGITWTSRTLPVSNEWQDVAWNGTVFCAVSDSGGTSTDAATSLDGITWARRALPTAGYWRGIAWGNDTFVAIEGVSGIAATSPDGIKWTQRTLPSASRFSPIAFNGTVFCTIVGNFNSGNQAATSPDGITWTAQTLPTTHYWSDIAWNGSVFCAIAGMPSGSPTSDAATSPDGITWTTRTMPSSSNWVAIAWNGTVFCAIAGAQVSTTIAATSPDGITWTAQTLPVSAKWVDISWNGTVFCAIDGNAGGNTTIAATSPDGITWTQRTLPVSSTWTSICASHLQFGTY